MDTNIQQNNIAYNTWFETLNIKNVNLLLQTYVNNKILQLPFGITERNGIFRGTTGNIRIEFEYTKIWTDKENELTFDDNDHYLICWRYTSPSRIYISPPYMVSYSIYIESRYMPINLVKTTDKAIKLIQRFVICNIYLNFGCHDQLSSQKLKVLLEKLIPLQRLLLETEGCIWLKYLQDKTMTLKYINNKVLVIEQELRNGVILNNKFAKELCEYINKVIPYIDTYQMIK